MSLNGGYAMIKYNSTQEELQIAYRSKKPVLFYDENQRSHWAVIEETATESVDEETQEPITLYEYSYRLIDEASSVVANPTLSGDEATLNGLEVDGTKYKVGGGKLYNHSIGILPSLGSMIYLYLDNFVSSKSSPLTIDDIKNMITSGRLIIVYKFYDNNRDLNLEYIGHLKYISDKIYYNIQKIGKTGENQSYFTEPTITDAVTEV